MSTAAGPRVVAITGASRGLGLAIARAFISRGDTVYGLSRDDGGTNKLVHLPTDLRSPEDIRRAFAAIEQREERLDILVSNAAVGRPEALESLTPASIDEQIAVNLVAPLLCFQAAAPLLSRSSRADAIFLSSESVLMPFPYLGVYAAAKAGLETAIIALRPEAAALGVRLTVARLGQLEGTTFSEGWTEEARAEAISAWTASGHLAFAGHGMAVDGAAAAITALPDLDRSARYDLVQLRSGSSL